MKQTDEKGNPLTYWGGLEEAKQDLREHPLTPDECFKQTLEEAAKRLFAITLNDDELDRNKRDRFVWLKGGKRQQERSYSEEDVIDFIKYTIDNFFNGKLAGLNSNEIFEQFKQIRWKTK